MMKMRCVNVVCVVVVVSVVLRLFCVVLRVLMLM